MVNVANKTPTTRTAIARGTVLLGKEAYLAVSENKLKKGDVLTVAKISGIQAAKQTSNLIPLCHPLMLSHISCDLVLVPETFAVEITSSVTCQGKTGVEMEAIMSVSVAACTVYDMCKAINKGIVITDIHLVSKTGGKSGDYGRMT
jgi:molybdenum cofactor biosynthesis protein MoaC